MQPEPADKPSRQTMRQREPDGIYAELFAYALGFNVEQSVCALLGVASRNLPGSSSAGRLLPSS